MSYPFISELMPLWYVFVVLFGLCLGSFLNVCIWRMPRGESIVFGRSHCPHCGHQLRWYENIPVLSWLILKGNCSNCKEFISIRYLVVEILTCILLVTSWWRVEAFGQPISLFLFYILAIVLFVVTFFVDIKNRIIPNKLTYGVMVISLLLALLFPQAMGKVSYLESVLNSLMGVVVGGGILLVFTAVGRLISGKWVLGGGDIKFVAAVGACFGLCPPVWFFVIFVASITGLITSLFLVLLKKKNWSSTIPFGPFLAIAGYLWILCGREIVNFYLSLCN